MECRGAVATKIKELAQMRAQSSSLSDAQKEVYSDYSLELGNAIKILDVAHSRCKSSPQDLTKHQDLENAVQNLQVTLLQSRPSLGDTQQNNIIDLNDFVKDTSDAAEKFMNSLHKVKAGKNKKEIEVMKEKCSAMKLNANRLLEPASSYQGDDNGADGILEVVQFAQDCDAKIENINSTIDSITDNNTKESLKLLALPLTESCNFLRFASSSALAATKGAALDGARDDLDQLEQRIHIILTPAPDTHAKGTANDASDMGSVLVSGSWVGGAAGALCRGEAKLLPPALLAYIGSLRQRYHLSDAGERDKVKQHLMDVVQTLKQLAASTSSRVALWQPTHCAATAALLDTLLQQLDNLPSLYDGGDKPQAKILNNKDLNRLLMPAAVRIEGDAKQISEKLHQSANKLVTLGGSLMRSDAQSLARAAPPLTDAAIHLAAIARSHPFKNAVQAQRTEEASQEMCRATYNLLRAAEAGTASHTARTRLRNALKSLTDTINKLTRAASTDNRLQSECDELSRGLQLQSALVSTVQPSPGAPAYTHCVQMVHTQREAIEKLSTDDPMSRDEFCQCLKYATAAVCNSTQLAAHAAYLISISEQHAAVARAGLVEVPRLQALAFALQDSCYRIMQNNQMDLAKEEQMKTVRLAQELHGAVKEAGTKSGDAILKRELTESGFNLQRAATALKDIVDTDADMDKVGACAMSLADCAGAVRVVLDRPNFVPQVESISGETKALADDVMEHSRKLVNVSQSLLKEVRAHAHHHHHDHDEDGGPMTWVSYNTARRNIIDAFQGLLQSLQRNGEKAGLVEVAAEIEEESPTSPAKSFVQMQEDAARKWLQRRPSDSEVVKAGRHSVTTLIDIAHQMCQDMEEQEKEELQNLITESRHLLTQCTSKYDSDTASALLELVREIRRGIEKHTVSRVVEDFLHTDEPLQDFEVLLDAEKDETKRKFLLERKIAELMSQLGRVRRVAGMVGRAGPADTATQLGHSTQQTELLAPLLVKAAQERVASPHDKETVQKYRTLLAQYTEALSKVRNLCDTAVDPLHFVQTAGETMSRMREESTCRNDPQLCDYTSKAITRLANRVIVVGMSSEVARVDPALHSALTDAQQKLTAVTTNRETHKSKLPDWTHTTEEILKTTGEVESALGGENIFKKLPEPDQPIYNAALSLHSAVRGWSARDNELVGVAKRMAVLMAKLSEQMNEDRKRELLVTSKHIVIESREVAATARRLAHECPDVRIRNNLLQVCERIPTISGQLKMLTTVKSSALGLQGGDEDREAMNMLVTNAQNLMASVQEVVKAAASASVKIASARGLKWVPKNY